MMIYAELHNTLVKLASPEVVSVFDEAIGILNKYEVPDYMDVFEKAIESAGELGDAAVLDALLLNMRTVLDYLLSMQGVELNDSVTMSERNAISDGLFEIAYYEDKDALLAILDSEQTTHEKVAELMALVSPYDADVILGFIESVDDAFVGNFKGILNREAIPEVSVAESVKVQIAGYTRFKRFCQNAPLYADRYFAQLGSIGIEYAHYVQWFLNDHPITAQTSHDQVAKELIGLALLSSDACAVPLMGIRKVLNSVYADLNEATRVDVAVTKVVMALGVFQA